MVSAALLEESGPPYFLCSSCSCFSAKSALSGYRSIAATEEEEEEARRGQHVKHFRAESDSLSPTFHITPVVCLFGR